MKYDDTMAKYDKSYDTYSCTVDLEKGRCLDPEDGGNFHEYTFVKVAQATYRKPPPPTPENVSSTTTVLPTQPPVPPNVPEAHRDTEAPGDRIIASEGITNTITSLANQNRYTFEFQVLNAHPSMPGLYFAASVGYPSDQLAVLFGGRARNDGDTKDVFFAQYEFDTTNWGQMKIIHTVMANALSKIEYMHNYLSEKLGPQTNTRETHQFCQELLDYITQPYIHEVLENAKLMRTRDDAITRIAHLRGVCECVFQQKYPFLDTSMWTSTSGEFTYASARVWMPKQLESESETRKLAYHVLSSCIEPEPAHLGRATARLDPDKINAFIAYDVFRAYASFRWKTKTTRPKEFDYVIEDARQLLINMTRLKTSSNFALVRLQKSCDDAVKVDAGFKYTRNCMLAASRNFISLLLRTNPSTMDTKFGNYVNTLAWTLSQNSNCDTDTFPLPEDVIDKFVFEEDVSCSKRLMTTVK